MKNLKKLSKFLAYVLGYRPDEFGLVLHRDGYVKIKDLLKAVHEEDAWKFIRRGHLNEIMISLPDPPIEIKGNLIRAIDRAKTPDRLPMENPPKLLYTCVRQKAHHAVFDKGISPMGRRHVVLSSDRKMAERIGLRIDRSPILLTVNIEKAVREGTLFLEAGHGLYVARYIPAKCFTGPPLPKESKNAVLKAPSKLKERDKAPGSFFPDFLDAPESKNKIKGQGKKKTVDWKESRKRMRRR